MKLWAKLTAVTVLTVLLGAGTAGAAVLFRSVEYNRQREMESCREQLSVAAYAMGREMDRTLLKEYSPAAKNSYLDFLLQKFGSASYILLENGEEICNQTLYRLKDGEKKIWQEEQAWSRFQKLEDGYFVIAGQSIPSGLDASYTLILIRDISDLYRQGKRQLAEGTVILTVTMLAAALLTFLFVKRILRPLGELEAAAKQISQGRLGQQVQVKGRDEIGELAEAFNHMSQQLERQVEELSQVADRRKLLLGSMAHEMKTPMTSIVGYADTLLHVKLKREQQEKALEHIYAASTRLERLSGKLMEPLFVKWRAFFHIEKEKKGFILFQRVRTFFLVMIGLVFFRSATVPDALRVLGRGVSGLGLQLFRNGVLSGLGLDWTELMILAVSILFSAWVTIHNQKEDMRVTLEKKPIWLRWIALYALLFYVILLGKYGPGYSASEFIYQNFKV